MEVGRGAEAVLEKKGNILVKTRIKKGYRIKEIDEKLRRERTKKEAKLLSEAKRARVNAPTVLDLKKHVIRMDFVDGKILRDHLELLENKVEVCRMIGESVAKLHSQDIIHGDLTTSNMILKEGEVFFIDFGLGFESNKIEDKAVDLRVLEEALKAKHYKGYKNFFKAVLHGYSTCEENKSVLKRLEEVKKRGRYL